MPWWNGDRKMRILRGTATKSGGICGKSPARTHLFRNFWLLLCLLLCCPGAGCSAARPPAEPPTVPRALLLPTPAPEWQGQTAGELVEYAQDLEHALKSANADKAAVRAIVAPDPTAP